MNARTSLHMFDKSNASHIKRILDRGTEVVDSVKAKRERYAAKNADNEES